MKNTITVKLDQNPRFAKFGQVEPNATFVSGSYAYIKLHDPCGWVKTAAGSPLNAIELQDGRAGLVRFAESDEVELCGLEIIAKRIP